MGCSERKGMALKPPAGGMDGTGLREGEGMALKIAAAPASPMELWERCTCRDHWASVQGHGAHGIGFKLQRWEETP